MAIPDGETPYCARAEREREERKINKYIYRERGRDMRLQN